MILQKKIDFTILNKKSFEAFWRLFLFNFIFRIFTEGQNSFEIAYIVNFLVNELS
jgi:hypothetical protein